MNSCKRSLCCGAPVSTCIGYGVEGYHICTKCNKTCDVYMTEVKLCPMKALEYSCEGDRCAWYIDNCCVIAKLYVPRKDE